jgi:drug/metabolite transporter (DMT)-like permease
MGYVLLAALTIFWGCNWPAMKIALTELPVWWFRSACLIVGGTLLLLIARVSGQGLGVPGPERTPLLFCTVFNVIGWHLCSAYGISLMPAGRAAIIAFTMPVWAAFLGSVILGEAVTRGKLWGLLLGVAGLAVLIGPDLAALGSAPLGAIFMVLAAMSWAMGTVAIKRFEWTMPTTSLIGWQLLIGAIPVTLGAILLEEMPEIGALDVKVLWATAYVFLVPMVFCQWAFIKTVRLFPATIAAIGTLAIPVVGVYASALALAEPIGWRELSALVLICAALAIVLLGPVFRQDAGRS